MPSSACERLQTLTKQGPLTLLVCAPTSPPCRGWLGSRGSSSALALACPQLTLLSLIGQPGGFQLSCVGTSALGVQFILSPTIPLAGLADRFICRLDSLMTESDTESARRADRPLGFGEDHGVSPPRNPGRASRSRSRSPQGRPAASWGARAVRPSTPPEAFLAHELSTVRHAFSCLNIGASALMRHLGHEPAFSAPFTALLSWIEEREVPPLVEKCLQQLSRSPGRSGRWSSHSKLWFEVGLNCKV